MKINQILSLSLITFLIFACDMNFSNIKVTGQVLDRDNAPVENAEISFTCWVYDTSIWASKKVNKIIYTNKDGYFETSFSKGEALDVRVSANSFNIEEESITLKRNYADFTFHLDRE